ncbi:glycosyltransferase family 4 protein [Thermodesulfobacteriota bacterium]
MDNFILFVSCSILGGGGAWFISRWGQGLGLLDKPNDRSSHEGVVPKGGGLGILAAFFVSSLILNIPANFWLSATFLALVSLCGDKVELSPKFRLPVQFMAASSFLFFTYPLLLIPYPLPLTAFLIIYIVGTANFYNFMDGINGIAGITGIVAFGLLSWFTTLEGADPRIIALSLCMTFACLGFLPFNVPKAKVFMGDVGSILLGFVFAGMVILLSKNLLDFICYSALIFPFYADELTTMVVRLRNGENLLHPHRNHIYQHLANEFGISHWKISVAYGSIQLIIGVVVWLLIKPFGVVPVIVILLIFFIIFIFINFIVRKKVMLRFEKIPL